MELLFGWVIGGREGSGPEMLHSGGLWPHGGVEHDGVIAVGMDEVSIPQEALHRAPGELPHTRPHVALAEILGRGREGGQDMDPPCSQYRSCGPMGIMGSISTFSSTTASPKLSGTEPLMALSSRREPVPSAPRARWVTRRSSPARGER